MCAGDGWTVSYGVQRASGEVRHWGRPASMCAVDLMYDKNAYSIFHALW